MKFIRIDPKIKKILRKIAKKERRPITQQIDVIVDEWIKMKEKKQKLSA